MSPWSTRPGLSAWSRWRCEGLSRDILTPDSCRWRLSSLTVGASCHSDNAVTRWTPPSSAGGGSFHEKVIQAGERSGWGWWWHYKGGGGSSRIIFIVDYFTFSHKPGSVTLPQVKTWNLRRNPGPARETKITINIPSSTNLDLWESLIGEKAGLGSSLDCRKISQAGGLGPLHPHHVPGGGDLEEGGDLREGRRRDREVQLLGKETWMRGKLHLLQLLDALWWRDLYLE